VELVVLAELDGALDTYWTQTIRGSGPFNAACLFALVVVGRGDDADVVANHFDKARRQWFEVLQQARER
jgi:hypothetical protein